MYKVSVFKKLFFVLLPILVFAVYGGQQFLKEPSVSLGHVVVAEINPPLSITTPQNV